jgi:hypothetical protein
MQLIVTLILCFVALSTSTLLTANYYNDATCTGESTLMGFIEMDKCLKAPDVSIFNMSSLPVKSLKASCTQNADGSIKIEGKGYAASGSCSGLGVPVKETIKPGCQNGGTFVCGADGGIAITNDWPSVGMYFGDSGCGSADAMMSFTLETCTSLKADDPSQSKSVKLSGTDTAYTATVYSDTACTTVEEQKDIPKTTCLNIESLATSLGAYTFYQTLHTAGFGNEEVVKELAQEFEGLKGGGATIYAFAATAKTVPGF